jgi:NADPH2:quinone reductase
VGQAKFADSLASLRPRGMLVLYGQASGPVEPFNAQRLARGGSLFLTRPSLAHYNRDREEVAWRAGDVLEASRAGSLDVRIHDVLPLESARHAHEMLEGRETSGKLLLRL